LNSGCCPLQPYKSDALIIVKTKRTLIQLCLVGTLLLSVAVVKADQFGDFTYASDGTNVTITGYTGSGGDVTIPDTINGLAVTSIGDWAFYLSSITNVLIPDSVANIGIYGFAYCYNLTNVTIGHGVTNIGSGAFIYSTSLATITVDAGNTFFSSVDGVLFNQSQTLLVQVPEGKIGSYTIPDTVTSIGVLAFVNCTSLTNVMIPNSVINIEYAAFVNCIGLTDILIPNGVTSIGVQAFSDCRRLANITIGSGVTNIGENAFLYCARLTAIMVDASNSSFSSVAGVLFNRSQTLLVQFPGAQGGNYSITNTVTSVGNGAFITCPYLTSVTIPNSVTNIGVNAFYDCTSLTNVAIPDSVISIGNFAFMECTSLRDVTIPDSVRNISEYMFYNCSSLTSVTIPDNVTNIGILAFERCASLTGFTVPNGVTSIADDTFWGCLSLTNVTIPNSVTNIGREAFYLCLSLTSVTIPNSVTRIGDNTFAGCAGLKGAFFNGNAPGFLGSDIFFNVPVIVYYLPGTTGWDDFALLTGVPTALWLPQMQTLGASFGVQTNEFGFNIQWASGQTVVVEACTNLVNPDWLPVQTNMLTTGSAYFSDPQWTNYPGRFYRLRSP